jgi:tetratricopeptide (TPR) repeat protein
MGFYAGNWHPLTWLSHALDYAIWGLNPLGHHLTNTVLHALNTLIVVFLVMKLMEVVKKFAENNGLSKLCLNDRTIRITGAATGLLFGLHPLHVESVAWVAERKDLLCAFFFLLTINAYINYVTEINAGASIKSASRFFNKQYIFAVGFFTLALLSKPMAVTLPFVLLILDWYPFRRIQSLKTCSVAFIEKLPFIVLGLGSSILTILAQESYGAIRSVETIPLTARLLVAVKSLIAYLGKILLPLNLVPFYPYPKNISFFSLEYSIPIVMVIMITVTCIAVVRNQRLWMSVWCYYVITLMPVLGLVQVGDQSMGDRYTYLPSLGPFLILGLLAARLYERTTVLKRWKSISKITGLCVFLVLIASLSYATIEQIGIWKNSFVLWNYVIDRAPSRAPIAHNNLGNVYQSQGLYDRAIEQYQAALRLEPDFAEAYYNLGVAYQYQGLYDLAIEQYQATLKLRPDYVRAHYNLGIAYQYQGLYDRAIEQYQAALKLWPYYAEAYNNLGNVYQSIGLNDMAIEHYLAALKLRPDLAEAHFNLGWSYLKKGSNDMARREYELGLTIKPDDYSARQVFNSLVSK